MSQMDPWLRLGIEEATLKQTLGTPNPDVLSYEVHSNGQPIGMIALRNNWLYGPYIRFLIVLEPMQGSNFGSQIIDWVVTRASGNGENNIWVCASDFNTSAIRFYERNGFQRVGALEGLVRPDESEILLRRRLDQQTTGVKPIINP